MRLLSEVKAEFNNPSIVFRSIPFWSWNDRLSTGELVDQVKDMKRQGMGGFFMHSREGLETEYMGKEWLEAIRATVEAAKSEGVKAWLYDEDRFPSGGAGGLVSSLGGDKFRAKAITLEVIQDQTWIADNRVLAVYRASVNGLSLRRYELVVNQEQDDLGEKELYLVFRREVSGPCEWFNNEAPVDNLNPSAVSAFIETTYEKYRQHVGDEFGETIPGIFTDEPSIADFHSVYETGRPWVPWTDGFNSYFYEKRGYDLVEHLPFIFFDGEKSSKIRHDYWRTISDLFCEAYSKQLGDWCEENGLRFTGHYLIEHNLGIATRVSGAIMPHYRYQQIPGIDILGEQTEEYLTVKQCTSVANQYRKDQVLSEMYGCCGWGFTFEGQKWVGDWQFVLGVNIRCQHLSQYSLKGCRKRDFPPSFNYNTSWWKYNSITEDYFARISSAMTEGIALRDVLVIHPSSSVWSMIGSNPYEYLQWEDPSLLEANKYEAQINRFIKVILGAHYDFDFGDETIMQEEGYVHNGKIHVKFADYAVVVLPYIKSLFKSTVKLLQDYMHAGGKVIALTPLATMVEGESANMLDLLFNNPNMVILEDLSRLSNLLEQIVPRRIRIRNIYGMEVPQILYYLKERPDSYALFLVNNDRGSSYETEITLSAIGRLEEWDLLTGEQQEIGVKQLQNQQMRFMANFGPAGSKLFVIYKETLPKEEVVEFYYRMSHELNMSELTLGSKCTFTRNMPNSLLLDVCSYSINGIEWSDLKFVWQTQLEVRKTLGMRENHYNGQPQRYKWIHAAHPNDETPLQLKFNFEVSHVPDHDMFLVVEDIHLFRITCNGVAIANDDQGWFLDKSFRKVKLTNVQLGENEIVLSCLYCNHFEIEDCYLIGDFGVDVNRVIVREPEQLYMGDWCLQGYFHYCGSITYHFDLPYNLSEVPEHKLILKIGDYSAVTIEVRINGQTAGHIPWQSAAALDMTAWLKSGNNTIDIEVMGSPLNLLGPFHQAGTHNVWVDWTFFSREGSRDQADYAVKPYGLLSPVHIVRE